MKLSLYKLLIIIITGTIFYGTTLYAQDLTDDEIILLRDELDPATTPSDPEQPPAPDPETTIDFTWPAVFVGIVAIICVTAGTWCWLQNKKHPVIPVNRPQHTAYGRARDSESKSSDGQPASISGSSDSNKPPLQLFGGSGDSTLSGLRSPNRIAPAILTRSDAISYRSSQTSQVPTGNHAS